MNRRLAATAGVIARLRQRPSTPGPDSLNLPGSRKTMVRIPEQVDHGRIPRCRVKADARPLLFEAQEARLGPLDAFGAAISAPVG